MQRQMHKKDSTKRGVVMLITLTVVTIVLILLAGIMSIATKQSLLSSLAIESQKAFYAADTGIECVLYWELAYGLGFQFATSSDSSPDGPSARDFCAGHLMNPDPDTADFMDWHVDPSAGAATTTVWFSTWSEDHDGAPDIANPCTKLTVAKQGAYTQVLSIGYNTCDTGAARRVTRAIYIDY